MRFNRFKALFLSSSISCVLFICMGCDKPTHSKSQESTKAKPSTQVKDQKPTPDLKKKPENQPTKITKKDQKLPEGLPPMPPEGSLDVTNIPAPPAPKPIEVDGPKGPAWAIAGDPAQVAGKYPWLTWNIKTQKLPIYESPSYQSKKTGEFRVNTKDKIIWTESVVEIVNPRRFEPKKAHLYKDLKTVDSKTQKTADEFLHVPLKKNDFVYLYSTTPQGLCYLNIKKGYYEGPCPHQDLFKSPGLPEGYVSAPMQPYHKRWWLKINEGWIEIKERTCLVDYMKEKPKVETKKPL